MLKTAFKLGFNKARVRPVAEIIASITSIISKLEENTTAAGETARMEEANAEMALAQAEAFRKQMEDEANKHRVAAGEYYDTANASAQQALKLKEVFGL